MSAIICGTSSEGFVANVLRGTEKELCIYQITKLTSCQFPGKLQLITTENESNSMSNESFLLKN